MICLHPWNNHRFRTEALLVLFPDTFQVSSTVPAKQWSPTDPSEAFALEWTRMNFGFVLANKGNASLFLKMRRELSEIVLHI